MQRLNPAVDVEGYMRRIPAAPQRVLMLDYDGTLAPFRIERDQAVPYPGVREVLAAIIANGNTRLVIVSGRPVRDLLRLLALEQTPEIWGSHGWEHRHVDGREEPLAMPTEALAGLDAAARWAEERNLQARIEEKPSSRALHWRGMDAAGIAELRAAALAAWEPIARAYRLILHPFDGGLELRVPGRDKGYAVDQVLHATPPDAAVAFLGDDRTDEDGFCALQGRGLGVLVRAEHKATAADLWLKPPEELLEFLRLWR